MTDSCYSQNSMGVMSIGQMIALFGPLVLFVCTIVMTVRMINRHRLAWWVPIVGVVGSIVLFLIGNGIATSGLP
ncbi:DUF6264 family protein [Labedella gwakjiensis]|nr:DUF6264 family protein [Labedella gwakjiensis]RUQ87594.1 hypothetical protein ELQ93_12000 [Labedella gwakjiensis]